MHSYIIISEGYWSGKHVNGINLSPKDQTLSATSWSLISGFPSRHANMQQKLLEAQAHLITILRSSYTTIAHTHVPNQTNTGI